MVHKWRSEEAGILVGTNTVMKDDPELTTRLWPGNSPIRLVVDMELRLPLSSKIFDRKVRTIIFNTIKHEEDEGLMYYQVTKDVNLVHQIVNALYQVKIQSVIVEGGARLLQSFIDEDLWDEARVIRNTEMNVGSGLTAPVLQKNSKVASQKIFSDTVDIYTFSN
jgi:diaminohydroxyphosphoribosylaminopyrimidine deaminase/5-amino-6-(5-phosphoribosylamino)uracil reductase